MSLNIKPIKLISPIRAAFMECKIPLLGAGVFSGFVNILMLTGSIYMMQVYDRVLNSRALPTLFGLTVLVLLLFCFMGAFEIMRQRIMARIGERMDLKVAPLIFNLVTTLPLHISAKNDGNLPLRDFDTIKAFLSGPALMTIFDLPWVPFYLLVCFMFHPWVGGVTVIGLAVLIFLTFLTDKLTKEPMKWVSKLQSERLAGLDNARRNAEILRAMGMTKPLREEWLAINDQSLDATRTASDRSIMLSTISKTFRMFLQSGVLAVGAILVIKGEATGGVMIACSVLTARAMAPIESAIAHWKSYSAAKASHIRLIELLDSMPKEEAKLNLPLPKESLSVRNISIVPPGAKYMTVSEVSFELKSGQGLALIGASASGKSSLAKALIGVWQVARGEVRFDGALMSQWTPELLGKTIGYLPQDVSLFQGTIAQNISRFDTESTPAKVIEASKAARVHELIIGLPQGYDTELNEQGSGLSQGQCQRIALARALYGNPFMVVLDEPNANLDADGEKALTESILEMRERGAIVIVIAHRPSAIVGLDLVAIMQKGKVVKFGTKESIFGVQSQTESGSIAPTMTQPPMKHPPSIPPIGSPSTQTNGKPLLPLSTSTQQIQKLPMLRLKTLDVEGNA